MQSNHSHHHCWFDQNRCLCLSLSRCVAMHMVQGNHACKRKGPQPRPHPAGVGLWVAFGGNAVYWSLSCNCYEAIVRCDSRPTAVPLFCLSLLHCFYLFHFFSGTKKGAPPKKKRKAMQCICHVRCQKIISSCKIGIGKWEWAVVLCILIHFTCAHCA